MASFPFVLVRSLCTTEGNFYCRTGKRRSHFISNERKRYTDASLSLETYLPMCVFLQNLLRPWLID
ncbi:MAG: hypothetical protein KME25_24575 [Symplocastrum torsivum CPER-KK1]|uniref:Uncharacterized protein n=1 Tax=Symplocastrum torsivum CPER-KK1 TaxID=450513 RepID=A0A951UBL9_9CYAN|nr:hypothetical protein [Symplocastrum torsivum CPER-KK1]